MTELPNPLEPLELLAGKVAQYARLALLARLTYLILLADILLSDARAEEELARGVQACAERLREIEEGIAELRGWVPELGEAVSLRMLSELELTRLREMVEEGWDQVDEVTARIHAVGKLADEYLLPRHALARVICLKKSWHNA
jgi:hypothetical protein